MWFSEQATLIGAIGLGIGVIILLLTFVFFDVRDGVRGKESFTGNVFDFFVRMAGMNFWHTRAFLIAVALVIVMAASIIVVTLNIDIV